MPDFFSTFPYHFLQLPNQIKLAYLDEGAENAPAILFLHGLGDNARIWNSAINALKPHYRCLAVDLPGHGRTQTEAFNFRMHEYAEVVTGFMQQLKISSFILVGHSMGGQIGMVLSLRFPAFIEKLILVAPAGFERFTESEKNMLQLSAAYGLQPLKNGMETPGKTTLQRSMQGMLEEPVFDFLPQLRMPTLIVFGEQDAFIPNRYLHPQTTASIARAGASRIPDADLNIFARCGHYPQTEQPDQFIATVLRFLK